MNNDLISREALKKTLCEEYEAKEHYIGEIMLKAIDNAPTVNIPNYGGQVVPDVLHGWRYEERPQGECDNCDYRKFTEQFINGVVEVMNKNGITSVEQLQEILKGGAEE